MRRLVTATVLVLILTAPVMAAKNAPRLEGIAYTEGAAEEIQVHVWALGEQVSDHPQWQFEAVFEGSVASGKSFSVDLGEARLPVVVELMADGHVVVSLQVVLPEQLNLPPAWLRRGERLNVRVTRGGKAAKDALVWGGISTGPRIGGPRRWGVALPRTVVPAAGSFSVLVPSGGSRVSLRGLTRDREFGSDTIGEARPDSTFTIALDSVPVEVSVFDRRGRLASGVSVIEAGSPAGVAIVTDEKGRATIQIPGRGQWRILALGEDVMGRIVGHSVPDTGIELQLAKRAEIEIRWPKELDPLVLQLRGRPAALRGTPRAQSGGGASLPAVAGPTGRCAFWGPSVGYADQDFEGSAELVLLDARPSVRIDGRVVAPEGTVVSSLPVWVGMTPQAMLRHKAWIGSRPDVPLHRPWLPWAVTDGLGRFSVAGLPAADYELEVRVPGFPVAVSNRLAGSPGSVLETVVELVPGTSLSLTVVDPEIAPLEGAIVDVFRSPRMMSAMGRIRFGGMPDRDPEVTGATNLEGRATLASVPVGTVRLRVSRSGSVTRTFDQIQVSAEGLDYGEVVLTPGVTVDGTTVGPDGEPVGGAEVALTKIPQIAGFRSTAVSDSDGGFSIADLEPSGEIYLQAKAEGLVPEPPLKVAMPPAEEVVVAMAVERVIEGEVLSAQDDTPIADAQIMAMVNMGARGTGRSVAFVGRTTTDDRGAFRIDELTEGRYDVTVSMAGWQQARQVVVVPGDSDPEPVIIRLDEGLELRGRVETTTGEPAAGLMVFGVRASSEFAGAVAPESSSTRTSEDGSFQFDDLGPGQYRLAARSEDGQAAEASAAAGQEELVVLRLEAGEVVTGVVLSEDGAPIPAAAVTAFREGGMAMPAMVETTADGRFRLENVRIGTITVFAEAGGHVRGSEKVEVVAGRSAEVELRLKLGGTVVGVVRGLGGSDLEQCHLFSDGGGRAQPAADGSFTLSGVEPGEREVSAFLRSDGRRRNVRTTVPEEGASQPVVIDFAAGVALAGRVMRSGQGVQGMTISASGVGSRARASTVSGAEGAYRIDGLELGEYEIVALSRAGEVLAGDHVLLETDTELDLEVPGGRLSGWVLEADTERPVEGATIRMTGSGLPAVVRTVATDASGVFAVEDLADGEYRVAAEVPGRAPAQESVTLRDSVPGTVTLRLGPEETTVLVVHEADGSPATRVFIMSSQGGLIGPSISVSCAEDGRCEVRDLPDGMWTLLIRGQGAALLRVSVPAGEVPVTLRSRGELMIRPGTDETGAAWQVRVSEVASGLIVPTTAWRNPGRGEWVPVPARGLKLWLPEGSWRIEAYAPDGTQSVREASVAAGGTTEVMLEE